MTTQESQIHPETAAGTVYVTLSGLPLFIELKWPFHRSTSGADFYVLHANAKLADGSGLHALASVNLSMTVKEVLPSLDPEVTEAPVINAIRKEIDIKQLELVKSPKLVPLHFSSRYYDFRRNRWAFGKREDEEIAQLLLRKVYWQSTSGADTTCIADPVDALYVDRPVSQLADIARDLQRKGLITLNGEYAQPTSALTGHASQFDQDMKLALAELEKKHAYERG